VRDDHLVQVFRLLNLLKLETNFQRDKMAFYLFGEDLPGALDNFEVNIILKLADEVDHFKLKNITDEEHLAH
jgi:hypothetical protein